METLSKKFFLVKVQQSQTLLKSALSQQVKVPYGCTNGGCGMCKVKVEEGEFELGLCSKSAFTDEERQNGYVLACRTYPKGDTKITLI